MSERSEDVRTPVQITGNFVEIDWDALRRLHAQGRILHLAVEISNYDDHRATFTFTNGRRE